MQFTLCSDGLPNELSWKCDPVLGDVNEDGRLDLAAIPRLGTGPRVWINQDGKWRDSSEGLGYAARVKSCGGGLELIDLNGDGHLDLAVADHCHGLFVYIGDETGKWEMVAEAMHPEVPEPVPDGSDETTFIGAEDLATGDVDNDGDADIVAGGSDTGGLIVYLNDGTGRNWTLAPGAGLPRISLANRVELVDLNKDGNLDILASRFQGPRVWLGDGKLGWTESSRGLPTPFIQGLYNGITVGDVNHDGLLDIACGNWTNGVELYLQQPDGSWLQSPDVFPQMRAGAFGVELHDVDQDGFLDLGVTGWMTPDTGFIHGAHFLKGDGRGGFTYIANSGLPGTGLGFSWGVVFGDINGDGISDMIFGSGGVTASGPGPQEPVLRPRLLVWCTQLAK